MTDPVDSSRMTLVEHLTELRGRLIASLAAVFVATIVCFAFAETLFFWLQEPLQNVADHEMIVLGPLEMFVTYIKLSVMAAIFMTAPFILVQIWLFIAPGLHGHERKWILPFVFLGSLFFIGGGAFAFYVVMPMGFKYLVAMVPETVQAQYSVSIYFSLVTRLLLAFGVVFELPLAMWILAAARVVSPEKFSSLRRYWVVCAVALAAFLTPPDPFTQMMMAVPLVLFFEIGIIGARMLYRRPVRSAQKSDET